MAEECVFSNGVNASTGDYLLPPLTIPEIVKVARGEKFNKHHSDELKDREHRGKAHLGVAEGIDPKKLSQTGWGIILAHDNDKPEGEFTSAELMDALRELLDHRKAQVNNDDLYREFVGADAYRKGESKRDFLIRFGVGPGPVNPQKKVPYYLLIVGDPEAIPYEFHYQMDVQFAVGRIWFETLEEYQLYARSVVETETGKRTLRRTATLFGPRIPDDNATQLSADRLITPLVPQLRADKPDWLFNMVLAQDATKGRLSHLIGGDETPDLLFVASHGIGFNKDDHRQRAHQGALICQDWPGTRRRQPIDENAYFSGDDIGSDALLLGTMAFFFACYGAGTPKTDDFFHASDNIPLQIAPQAFIAGLPRRMLGHPNGGALAVVGHVDRAWAYSFLWDRAGEQLEVFRSTFKRLMEGHPIGSALEYFNQRYAEIATEISELQNKIDVGNTRIFNEFVTLWTANHDARNYVIIGDPAVRLPSGKSSPDDKLPTIDVSSLPNISLSNTKQQDSEIHSHDASASEKPTTMEERMEKLEKRVLALEEQVAQLRS